MHLVTSATFLVLKSQMCLVVTIADSAEINISIIAVSSFVQHYSSH